MSDRAWALALARWTVGLTFLMAGWWKVFSLGPLEHARRFFVGPYADSWIPAAALWAAGTAVPLVELVAGAMLVVGLRVRAALVALVGVLVLVTYGHLLAEPLFSLQAHVFPRAAMVFLLLWLPREIDVLALDHRLEDGAGSGAEAASETATRRGRGRIP